MLTIMPDVSLGFIEVTIDGAVTADEFEGAVAAIDEIIARHGKANVLEVIRRKKKMSLQVWWRDVKFSISHFGKFGRYAVVTGNQWYVWMMRVFGAFNPMQVRIFAMADVEAARVWARGGSPGKRDQFVDFRPKASNGIPGVP